MTNLKYSGLVFTIIKQFGTGVIIATAFIHVGFFYFTMILEPLLLVFCHSFLTNLKGSSRTPALVSLAMKPLPLPFQWPESSLPSWLSMLVTESYKFAQRNNRPPQLWGSRLLKLLLARRTQEAMEVSRMSTTMCTLTLTERIAMGLL